MPHSQHSLRENPKFLLNFRPKNYTLKGNFRQIFSFNIYYYIPGLTFKSKNYLFYITKLCVLHKRKFPKLTSETQVSFVNEAPGLTAILKPVYTGLVFLIFKFKPSLKFLLNLHKLCVTIERSLPHS